MHYLISYVFSQYVSAHDKVIFFSIKMNIEIAYRRSYFKCINTHIFKVSIYKLQTL